MRAIDGFSHILQEEYADLLDEEGKRYIGTISRNASRMGQLISDILDFSRTARRELAVNPVDMTALAQDVYNEARAAVPRAGILSCRWERCPAAQGDQAMLRQVWMNVLSNAIKYTGHRVEAVIEVNGKTGSGEAIIGPGGTKIATNRYWVKDNGVGFDMCYTDKIFGVFQRLHGDDEFEGTGIGLAIVKRIVTRHGGQVWAESKLNEGTILYFTLPASVEQGE